MIAIDDRIDALFEAHANGWQDISAIVFCDPFRMKLFVDYFVNDAKKCKKLGIVNVRAAYSPDGCYYTSSALLFENGAICFLYYDFDLFDEYCFSSAKMILKSECSFNVERILRIAEYLDITDLLPSWLQRIARYRRNLANGLHL